MTKFEVANVVAKLADANRSYIFDDRMFIWCYHNIYDAAVYYVLMDRHSDLGNVSIESFKFGLHFDDVRCSAILYEKCETVEFEKLEPAKYLLEFIASTCT